MSIITTRTVKGASVSQSENDVNMEAISGLNLLETGATYAVDIDDQNNTIEFTSASAVAVTLDEIAVIIAAANTSDFKVTLIAIGAGAVTITPDAADTINTGISAIVLNTNDCITIQTDSTNLIWNVISTAEKAMITGVYTSGSIGAGAEEKVVDAIDVTELGTDDFDFGASIAAAGAGTIEVRQVTAVNFMNANEYTFSAGLHRPDEMVFEFNVAPTTGFLSTIINNGDPGNSIVATIRWWARAR